MSPLFASRMIFAIIRFCASRTSSSTLTDSFSCEPRQLSRSISHDPGATRAYAAIAFHSSGSPRTCSPAQSSPPLAYSRCSSVSNPFAGWTRGLPKGCTKAGPTTATVDNTITAPTCFTQPSTRTYKTTCMFACRIILFLRHFNRALWIIA
jgi:hypothetical protein